MKPQRVILQPLGVVGAMVLWNFPVNLGFTGLIHTFAAGKRAMVTMSKNSHHLAQHNLLFRGVGDSGMGHYHGCEGFVTFSKMRPVFYQARFSAVTVLRPSYGKFATKYLDSLTH